MYSRLNHHLPTNDILVSEQYGFWREIPTENAATELTVYSILSKKCKLEGFSVIWQGLLTV